MNENWWQPMNCASRTRYVDWIGRGPKRRCDTVCDPDFFESYTKYAWTCTSGSSPMILIVFLLAPTVPSAPRP